MKTLILGTFSEGSLENQYVRNLKKLGWEVHCFEMRADVDRRRNESIFNKIEYRFMPRRFLNNLNIKVIEFAKTLRPSVIIVFKGMELFPEVVEELKNYCSLICNYNPDHPTKYCSKGSGNPFVLNSIKYYDIYISYSRLICRDVEKTYKISTACIPFGYDDTITLSKYSKKDINGDFVFAGAWDKERDAFLKGLREFPVTIFGPNNWSNSKDLGDFYAGYSVYDDDYSDVCYSAYGMLNILRPHNIIEKSHNMRTFEVPGYGGLLISNRTEEQLCFFEEDKEAIFFEGLEELKDKLTYYSTNKDVVQKIKYAAFERSQQSGYSYFDRARSLVNLIEKFK